MIMTTLEIVLLYILLYLAAGVVITIMCNEAIDYTVTALISIILWPVLFFGLIAAGLIWLVDWIGEKLN